MGKILWLPDILRDAGLKVYEMPGWENSQSGSNFSQNGIVCHHTVTGPGTSDEAVRNLLRNGRSDLDGPLAQMGLRRDGTFDIIAAGRANHNGYGEWGNDSIGIEGYNDGVGEPWPQAQMMAFEGGSAAICRYLGWTASKVKGHKETDPDRKIDPLFDMNRFRSNVTALLDDDGDEMPTPAFDLMRDKRDNKLWRVPRDGQTRVQVKTTAIKEYDLFRHAWFGGDGKEVQIDGQSDYDWLDSVPIKTT